MHTLEQTITYLIWSGLTCLVIVSSGFIAISVI